MIKYRWYIISSILLAMSIYLFVSAFKQDKVDNIHEYREATVASTQQETALEMLDNPAESTTKYTIDENGNLVGKETVSRNQYIVVSPSWKDGYAVYKYSDPSELQIGETVYIKDYALWADIVTELPPLPTWIYPPGLPHDPSLYCFLAIIAFFLAGAGFIGSEVFF